MHRGPAAPPSQRCHRAPATGHHKKLRFPELTVLILAAMALTAGLTSAQISAQTLEPAVPFQILVFNYTKASPESLAVAEREAGRILAEAGFLVTWLNCPVTPGGSATTKRLRQAISGFASFHWRPNPRMSSTAAFSGLRWLRHSPPSSTRLPSDWRNSTIQVSRCRWFSVA